MGLGFWGFLKESSDQKSAEEALSDEEFEKLCLRIREKDTGLPVMSIPCSREKKLRRLRDLNKLIKKMKEQGEDEEEEKEEEQN